MIIFVTIADSHDFRELVAELESDLRERDGEKHAFYADLNRIDTLDRVIVVYDQDEAAGCGAARQISDEAMEIKRMYVRPAFRNKGIATVILKELEKFCANQACRRCVLETGKNQPEAIAFYNKNGYTEIPRFGRYSGSENSVCFEKVLRVQAVSQIEWYQSSRFGCALWIFILISIVAFLWWAVFWGFKFLVPFFG